MSLLPTRAVITLVSARSGAQIVCRISCLVRRWRVYRTFLRKRPPFCWKKGGCTTSLMKFFRG